MKYKVEGLGDAGLDGLEAKAGVLIAEGGVNVGRRVGGKSMMNWAASVGLTVGVVRGVGSGGGSTMGTSPERVTNQA